MPPRKSKRKRPASQDAIHELPSFDEIMAIKEMGGFEFFSRLLTKALESHDKDLRAQACYEFALLNCQQNKHNIADYYLRRLGYRYKLSKRIWQYNQTPPQTDTPLITSGLPGVVQCFDDVMPPALLCKLQGIFSTDSPFWREHQYPSDSFFSYNVPLPPEKTCSNLMEQVATYLKPFVAASFPELPLCEVSSIEWWAHSRSTGASAGHRLHYDLDETSLQERGELSPHIHPFVSSVLYLDDGGGSGAPTLVTNQSVLRNVIDDDGEEEEGRSDIDSELDDEGSGDSASEGSGEGEEMAWMCPPKTNRLLLFEGSLLHGVVPHIKREENQEHEKQDLCMSSGVGKNTTAAVSPRVTLMIGWWAEQVSTSPTPKTSLATPNNMPTLRQLKPNMEMPVCNESQMVRKSVNRKERKQKKKPGLLSWPELFHTDTTLSSLLSTSSKPAVYPSDCLLQLDGDIWEEVGEGDGGEDVIDGDVDFLGNWFLKSRTEVLDQVEFNCQLSRQNNEAKSDDGGDGGAFGFMSAEDLRKLRGE